MRRTSWGVLAVAMLLAVAACDADDSTPDAGLGGTGSPEPLTSENVSPAPESPEPDVADEPLPPRGEPTRPSPVPRAEQPPPARSGESPRDYLDAVVADAAQRAGVPRAQVQVDRDQAVQWRDGSLGCPEPGMMYTQAIVDGYWVELTAGGERYDYRLDGQGNYRLCEQLLRDPPYTDR